MKLKVIAFVILIIFLGSMFVYSNYYLVDASNYISVEKIKNDMGTEYYNELISYFSAVGYSKEDFDEYITNHQKQLQADINELSYIQKINLFLYYDNSISTKASSTIIKNEVEYVNGLADDKKEVYKNIVERLLFDE